MIVQPQHCQPHRQLTIFVTAFSEPSNKVLLLIMVGFRGYMYIIMYICRLENRDSLVKVLLLQLSIYRLIISLTSNNYFVESTFQ